MDIYHVLNRGVEKRDIVLNDDDRMRFVRSLYIFNDHNNAPNSISQSSKWTLDTDREPLVHIHAWCLMNNHYHLLLSPTSDATENISLFMKKLNMGYAKFFNEKYQRSGYLWQGKYKKILISNDAHFEYIPYYIHLNPLDYTHYEWRNGSVTTTNVGDAFKSLTDFRWSSYQDYTGKKNFPSILYPTLLNKVLGDAEQQNIQIKRIISENNSLHTIQSNLLEK